MVEHIENSANANPENKKFSKDTNPNDLRRLIDHAIQYGTREDFEDLFENGMDVDQEDWQGRTALQMMSYKGKKDMVEMLLSRGANVNAVFMYHDRIPKTALDAATEAKRNEIVNILVARGAKTGKELTQSPE